MKHRRQRRAEEAENTAPLQEITVEEKKAAPKGRKIFLAVGIPVVCIALAIVAFFIAWPYMQHNEAKELLAAGDYAGSIAILDELVARAHEGADGTLSEAHHKVVQEKVDAGEHAPALEYAQTYPCFTAQEIEELDRSERYHRALGLMEQDAGLVEAQGMFAELGEYRDSAAQSDTCLFRLRVLEAQGYADALDFELAMKTLANDQLTQDHENIALYEQQRLDDLAAAREALAGKAAAGAFYTLTAGEKTELHGHALHMDMEALQGDRLIGGAFTAGAIADGKLTFTGYKILGAEEAAAWTNVKDAAIGVDHILGLLEDGTVRAVGQDMYGKLAVSEWSGITDVAAGLFHSVGLKEDGTVVAVGENSWGQCEVAEWNNIVQVAAGLNHTLGLRADGTVVACGENGSLQCEVGTWKNVVRVYASAFTSYGLCADGTVLACGDNTAAQCEVEHIRWAAELAPGFWNLTVLHRDGSVSFVGDTQYEQKSSVNAAQLLRYEADVALNGEETSDILCEKVLWPVDKNNGPWLYAADDMLIYITLHYEEDCRSRFYTSHIYTAGGTDKIIDGFWTENGRGIAHPQKIARKYQAIYAQNCNYPYDPENDWRGPDIRNGKILKKSMGPDFFYIDQDGQMVTALTRAEEWTFAKVEALGVEHVYGFGPTLVQKGVLIDEKHMRTSGIYGNNPRSAIGSLEAGHYVGIVVDGRKPGVSVGVNLTRLGEQFLNMGCTEAYNLDGGQSSCMVFMGEMVTNHNGESMFNGQRILPDMLIFGTSELSTPLE